MKKMLNFMNRGGSKRLKLSRFNMFGLGTWMMKKFMKEVNYPSLDEMITMAQEMGVKLIPCSTTCGIMGISDEDAFREQIGSLAGAAFFLNEARQSKVTLFI
jgi:peroxiredoxin family protein